MLIDTHAHYDDKRFNADRHEIIAELEKSGVDLIINAGANLKSSRSSAALADKYDFIYATAGVHPHDAERTPEDTLDVLAGLLENKKVIAVGEIGLDFYHDFAPRESQRYWFKKQLDFSHDTGWPVVIHDREAHGETLEAVKKYKYKSDEINGVFHCFAGSVEMARELVKLGYMMSFGGVVTFANARTCIQVLEAVPAEYIMLETDCPYLSPHPNRGQRNDSRNLKIIAEKIAQVKNMDVQELINITGENAVRCFRLDL